MDHLARGVLLAYDASLSLPPGGFSISHTFAAVRYRGHRSSIPDCSHVGESEVETCEESWVRGGQPHPRALLHLVLLTGHKRNLPRPDRVLFW